MTINEQIRFHQEQIEIHQAELKQLKDKAEYCHKCGSYYPTEDGRDEYSQVEGSYREHPSCEFDDAAIYDCTYLIRYRVCPLCQGLTEVKREAMNLRNKHYAGQTLKWSW